jgi:Putative bacterial sensory transduction regulator
MEFANDAQRAVYERVTEYMGQLFGEEAHASADSPELTLARGSAEVTVSVTDMPEGPVVAIYSWVATGVQPSIDLFRHLLEQNLETVWGAYGIDDAGGVLFRHAVPGTSIDKPALRAAVKAVADVADAADDDIVRRFGGKRADGA